MLSFRTITVKLNIRFISEKAEKNVIMGTRIFIIIQIFFPEKSAERWFLMLPDSGKNTPNYSRCFGECIGRSGENRSC